MGRSVESPPPMHGTDPRVLIAVPNVSEGRDRTTVDAIAEAYVASGARMLDVHVDPDHHRSVHTLMGAPGSLADALVAGAAEAIAGIDLRTDRGIHPHVGAIDVCPVVYLHPDRRGAAILEALVAADRLGRLGLPVFLYGALAGGRSRAEVRRGGTVALAQRIASGELRPDFGPARLHPTAGAVLVGARPPLVAFNVELAAPATVDQARRIAGLIREGGAEGLPGVRAIGLQLQHPAGLIAEAVEPGSSRPPSADAVADPSPESDRPAVAQVSCNVEDHRAVPLGDLVRAIARHAPVSACEVVGLPPAEAFTDFPVGLLVRGRRTLEEALGLDPPPGAASAVSR